MNFNLWLVAFALLALIFKFLMTDINIKEQTMRYVKRQLVVLKVSELCVCLLFAYAYINFHFKRVWNDNNSIACFALS